MRQRCISCELLRLVCLGGGVDRPSLFFAVNLRLRGTFRPEVFYPGDSVVDLIRHAVRDQIAMVAVEPNAEEDADDQADE